MSAAFKSQCQDYSEHFINNNSHLDFLDKMFVFPIWGTGGTYDYYEMTFRECVVNCVLVGSCIKRMNSINDPSIYWEIDTITPYNLYNYDVLLSDSAGKEIRFNEDGKTWRYI